MLIIYIFIDFIFDNNLILSISEMQKDALIVSALGLAYEVLAVLDSPEEDLHSLVEVEESLGGNELTMNAAAADWALE